MCVVAGVRCLLGEGGSLPSPNRVSASSSLLPFEAGAVSQRLERVLRAELLFRAELVLRLELLWLRARPPLAVADFCDVWRTLLSRSSGNSEARVLASFMTPLAWRANGPLVASAYSPAPAAGRITQRDPKLPLRTPLPFAASATSSRRSARSIICSENLWTSAISLTPFSMSTVAATFPGTNA
jgi:hypothetical protein